MDLAQEYRGPVTWHHESKRHPMRLSAYGVGGAMVVAGLMTGGLGLWFSAAILGVLALHALVVVTGQRFLTEAGQERHVLEVIGRSAGDSRSDDHAAA